MPSTTRHNRFLLPLPTETGKTSSFDLNFQQIEAGRTLQTLSSVVTSLYQPMYILTAGGFAGQWALASDNSPFPRFICVTGANSGSAAYGQVDGVVTNSNWNWTVGNFVYVNTVVGTLTQGVPAGTSVPIGIAISSIQTFLTPWIGGTAISAATVVLTEGSAPGSPPAGQGYLYLAPGTVTGWKLALKVPSGTEYLIMDNVS